MFRDVYRDNGVALGGAEMAYQQMAAALSHINESQPTHFLQQLAGSEAWKRRHQSISTCAIVSPESGTAMYSTTTILTTPTCISHIKLRSQIQTA